MHVCLSWFLCLKRDDPFGQYCFRGNRAAELRAVVLDYRALEHLGTVETQVEPALPGSERHLHSQFSPAAAAPEVSELPAVMVSSGQILIFCHLRMITYCHWYLLLLIIVQHSEV